MEIALYRTNQMDLLRAWEVNVLFQLDNTAEIVTITFVHISKGLKAQLFYEPLRKNCLEVCIFHLNYF